MKKMISLVLTIAMMLSLAIPASAADATIGSTESGSNSASTSVKASYTPSGTTTPAITGVSVEVRDASGNTVNDSNGVYTIKSGYTVTVTATGTALDKATDSYVIHAAGMSSAVSSDWWTRNDSNTTATRTLIESEMAANTSAHEIRYSNDNQSTWISTGIKLLYDDSTSGGDGGGGDLSDTDEAKWGASATDLSIGSGTLAQAFAAAAKSDSTVKYIRLQTNVTATTNYRITGGSFTLDLNGNSITVNDNYSIEVDSATVTLADSVGTGKVEATGAGGAAVTVADGGTVTVTGGSYEGNCALATMGAATITIKDGTFTATGEYAISIETGRTLTIEGGTFTGGSWASVATSGTTKISGGSFAAGSSGHILYGGGTLDLGGYPTTTTAGTTAITELTVQNNASETVTVGDTTIKLPEGYAFYKSDDADKTTVNELAAKTIYAIKSTSGSTTDEVAITGMAIKIDGTTYDSSSTSQSAPAKIGPDSTVTIVARGTNLNNATANNKVIEGPFGAGLSIVGWTCNADNTEATREKKASFFDSVINAFQFQYSNDGGTTWIDSGVWIVYEDPNPPTITGVSVTVDGQTYTSGTVIITPTSGDVTITVMGTNLDRATAMNIIQCAWNDVGRKVMNMATDSDGNRYITLSPTEFTANTTAFNVGYSNSGATTMSGIYIQYQTTTTSVEITWGSMSFTYSDEQVDGVEKGWTCADGANTVTVENKGTATVEASVTFTGSSEAANITNVTGSFD